MPSRRSMCDSRSSSARTMVLTRAPAAPLGAPLVDDVVGLLDGLVLGNIAQQCTASFARPLHDPLPAALAQTDAQGFVGDLVELLALRFSALRELPRTSSARVMGLGVMVVPRFNCSPPALTRG